MNQQEDEELIQDNNQEMIIGQEFQQFCAQVSQIQENLTEYIQRQQNGANEENQSLLIQLQENLLIIQQKISSFRPQEAIGNREEFRLLMDQVSKIVQQANEPQSIQYERNDLDGLEIEFPQPKRIRGGRNSQERKQERKRARIQRSKQALQVFKKYIILTLIGFQKFIKDPENIAKLFVIAVSCFFVSSYLQIPDMSNRHSLYIFEWLAYNRCARVVLISGSFCFVSLIWYIIIFVWIGFMGLNETKGKLNTLIHECNPFYRLTLIFMTDNDLINNKLDLAIWFCYIFQYATYRVYYLHSTQIIKKILSSLTTQNFQKVYQFQQIKLFSMVILTMNFLITFVGILLLNKVGFYALSLLFYGGIQTSFEYMKIILVCQKLQQKYTYFINNNIEQLTEPQFYQEIIPDILIQALKILFCSQLIVNYFRNINFHIFLHLWLFQIFSDFQSSLQELKTNIDQLVKYKRIQQNVDELFPRSLDVEEDEICIICHEELILARKLPCQHRFHLKCLFGWLKAQQQCPVCRAQVPIQLEQEQQIFSRIFSFITSFSISNFTFLFYINSGRQQDFGDLDEQLILRQQIQQQQQQLREQQQQLIQQEQNQRMQPLQQLPQQQVQLQQNIQQQQQQQQGQQQFQQPQQQQQQQQQTQHNQYLQQKQQQQQQQEKVEQQQKQQQIQQVENIMLDEAFKGPLNLQEIQDLFQINEFIIGEQNKEQQNQILQQEVQFEQNQYPNQLNLNDEAELITKDILFDLVDQINYTD